MDARMLQRAVEEHGAQIGKVRFVFGTKSGLFLAEVH